MQHVPCSRQFAGKSGQCRVYKILTSAQSGVQLKFTNAMGIFSLVMALCRYAFISQLTEVGGADIERTSLSL